MPSWHTARYARFSGPRGRAFADLLQRVHATAPGVVVDLGCGDGTATMSLLERWPDARVIGVDSSPDMLLRARALDRGRRVSWIQQDLATWGPEQVGAPVGVLVANASLHWVPDHLAHLTRWAAALPTGAWLAVQIPGNDEQPSHVLMRDVAAAHPRAKELLAALARRSPVETPRRYAEVLVGLGYAVDAWETTYLHLLDPAGELDDPVLEWVSGTGLRPVLDLLTDPAERAAFLAPYRTALREAYPRDAGGVPFGFRRVFVVAERRST